LESCASPSIHEIVGGVGGGGGATNSNQTVNLHIDLSSSETLKTNRSTSFQ
jgi:hypothetical protein